MSNVVFPNGGRSVVEQMCAKFPELHVNDDDKQRQLSVRCQEQFAYQWGGKWGGKKRAGGGTLSKDSMAYLENGGATSTWDMFQGNADATILVNDGTPPDFPDMPTTEAEFVPVTGRDWLGIPSPGPGPGPGPDTPDDEIITLLHDIQATMASNQGALIALGNYNTERVLQRIDDVKSQMEESLKKVLAIYMAMNRGDGEILPPETAPPGDGGAGLSDGLKAILMYMLQNRPSNR